MKIIYFTTASSNEDYVSLASAWNFSLNTSVQKLHNRLIRALALTHEVEVISVRPFSRRYCKIRKLEAETKHEGKITWNYLEIKRAKIARFGSIKRQCKKLLSKMNLKDAIVLTDTLNPNVLKNSTLLAKKFGLPIIGVCSNTPSGIRNTGKSFTTYLLSQATDLSGYISLTTGLNELFNKGNRANISFEGILDEKYQKTDFSGYGKYIYYDGNLDENYGVYNLIKAFKELNNSSLSLVISGYHPKEALIQKAIDGCRNIQYLGLLHNDEVLSLTNQSLININPRPYSEDFDRYMIPDDLVDYLGSSSITLSVKNRHFRKSFENDVIWIDSNDVEDLVNGLKKALSLTKENRNSMIKKANADAEKLYSMNTINRRIFLFLKQFLKQKE